MSKKQKENNVEALVNKLKDPNHRALKNFNRLKKKRRINAKS